MEELTILRKYIEERDYLKALELVSELEEMSTLARSRFGLKIRRVARQRG